MTDGDGRMPHTPPRATIRTQLLVPMRFTEPRVALLSNNPDKVAQLSRLGVTVVERLSTRVHVSAANARYLSAKSRRGSHLLDGWELEQVDTDDERSGTW